MDWSAATLWWLAAGVLIAIELLSGTFYLLMVALGAIAAALTAQAGLGGTLQWLAAAAVGAGATAAWHFSRAHQPRSVSVERNADANIDIGEHVRVDAWAADGSSRVQYRGSLWTVRFAGNGQPAPGEHTIVSVQGGHLGVAPSAPH